MKYDFHAQYPLLDQDNLTQAYAIDYLTGVTRTAPKKWPDLDQIQESGARLQLLAQAIESPYKDRARMGQLKNVPGGLWHWIQSGAAKAYLSHQRQTYLEPLGLLPAWPEVTGLSRYSFALQFTFTLRRPYLSRDETDFYILDNPVKKEWVFKVPYVAPSQWKGSLRAAIMREIISNLPPDGDEKAFTQKRLHLFRIFGNEQEDAVGFRGRLHFYPTFFDQIGLAVINPHDRRTGVGKQPIYFECVPQGATGTFTLLYVPLDRIGEKETETRAQVAQDLRLVAEGIRAMMTVYGFGAKTSSGFGVAQENCQGQLQIKAAIPDSSPAEPPSVPLPPPDLPRYLSAPNQLHPDFQAGDGGLISEADYQQLIEDRGKKYTKSDKQLYAKAKSWWEREGQQLVQQPEEPETEPEPAPETTPPYPPVYEPFDAFTALPAKAQKLADTLHQLRGDT
jgi:CRISPR-associated protein Cmr2